MDKPMPDVMFKGMSAMLKVRDLVRPRGRALDEVGIKPGDRVLDYGCGPGGYIAGTAQRVGESGQVYALDIHPLAVERVSALAEQNGLTNVQTIQSDCQTGLPDDSLDVVLLYDIYHLFSEPQVILAEIHRVLKPGGVLSLSDHHMQKDNLIGAIVKSRLFDLVETAESTISFAPVC